MTPERYNYLKNAHKNLLWKDFIKLMTVDELNEELLRCERKLAHIKKLLQEEM